MQKVFVPINFSGHVTVDVPGHLSRPMAVELAHAVALSKIVASLENPDAPDDQAFEDVSVSEEDWDKSTANNIFGVWSVVKSKKETS